jgi:pimeloyl-ACP methyl ester carboxylesterase
MRLLKPSIVAVLVLFGFGGFALASRRRRMKAKPMSVPGDDASGDGNAAQVTTWVSVGHSRIFTRRWRVEHASREPVVLVHGYAASSAYMAPTGHSLGASLPVFAPDLPGYGRSSRPERVLGIPELAEALAGWMDAAGIERATFLGNSFGCQIIVELALRHPERVSRAVLVGPTIDPTARSVPRQAARLARDAFREPLPLAFIQTRDYLVFGPRRLLRTLQVMLDDPVEEKLPHVIQPTLVVRGGHDPIVPQRWTEKVARLLPEGRLAVVPRAAHAVNYSAPDELARLVLQFLADDAFQT